MGAAALDPAPSAGVCRDDSDLTLQSFGRVIDVAMICRSIRIPGKLSTSGRGSRTSSVGSRRSDTFPRSSAGVPRQPLGVRKRSRSARESSEAARLRSAVIVCRSAGVPPECVRRRREAAQLSACSSLLWDPASLKAGAAGAALCPVITLWSPRSTSVGSVSVSV